MKNLCARVILCLAIYGCFSTRGWCDGYKTKVTLFKNNIQRFEDFQNLLKANMVVLGSDLKAKGAALKYLENLAVDVQPPPSEMSPRRLEDIWLKSSRLAIVAGNAQQKDTVLTTVYLFGSKGTHLSKDYVTLKFDLEANQLGKARDSHSMVFLFALAMDAKRLNLPTHVRSTLLDECYSRAKQLARKFNEEDIKLIMSAVLKERDELRGAK